MRYAIALFLSCLLVVAGLSFQSSHAQPTSDAAVTFSVEAPPSGALDRDQLRDIADTIRRLEKHPTADGAEAGRTTLVQWLQASPDVTVTMCPSIASAFTVSQSPALRAGLQQHLLSTAAYEIEQPESSRVDAKLSGLRAALQVNQVMTGGNAEAQPDGIKTLLQLQEEGKLRAHVEKGLEQCEAEK